MFPTAAGAPAGVKLARAARGGPVVQPFTRVLLAVLMCVVVLVAPSPSPAPAQEVPETAPPPGFAIVDRREVWACRSSRGRTEL